MRYRSVGLPGSEAWRHHRNLRRARGAAGLTRGAPRPSDSLTFVLSCSIDLHLPGCRSLKEKRGALKPIVEGLRRRHEVAVAEVDHQNTWQRSTIGLAAVSSSVNQVTEIVDAAERFVWSFPDIEVLDVQRDWLEVER